MAAFLRTFALQAGSLLLALAALSVLAAWARGMGAGKADAGQVRVALFVNGTLGDKSFYDSAARGLARVRQSLPAKVKVVEGGVDPTRWEAALSDLADSGDYDLIVTGTFTMVPYVQKLAAEFAQARFIVFDASVDYARCRCQNVHSILFRQNEGAYLAGFLAARLAERGLPGMAAGSALGVVGGMQFPVIDDFIVGFKAGAEAGVAGTRVLSQYANSFSDPAAGKEVAKAQYAQGAGIVFHAAGATGQGVNEAAVEAGRYAIGVDMDQYAMYRQANPQRAARIITSVLKNVDVALYQAVQKHLAGTLAFGRAESLGLAEGGVSLAPVSDVLALAPASLLKAVDDARQAVAGKRVRVPSAFALAAGAAP
jgi:basic membrane protein A and related proteins